MKQELSEDVVASTSKAFDAIFKTPTNKSYAIVTPKEWKDRYIAHMIKQGVDEVDAMSDYEAINFGGHTAVYDVSDNPEDAALEDLSFNYD